MREHAENKHPKHDVYVSEREREGMRDTKGGQGGGVKRGRQTGCVRRLDPRLPQTPAIAHTPFETAFKNTVTQACFPNLKPA